MTLETRKTKVKTRGYEYEYLYAAPTEGKPTVFFLHGFPESKYCWRYQTKHLSERGYGIMCPDLLGYGGTSKPHDYKEYAFADMVVDLAELLDAEGLSQVVVVGHDWGSLPCARFVNFFPERVLATVFLAAGYFPPGSHWDIDAYNAGTLKAFGYETMGYFDYQGTVTDDGSPSPSAKLTQGNIDSFMALLFPADPLVWKTDFCPLGKLKEWLEAGKTGPLNPHLSDQEVAEYKSLIKTDIDTNLNWYRTATHDTHYEGEQKLPEGREMLKAPVLFLGAKNDYACQPVLYTSSMPQFCPDLTVEEFDASHWLMWEKPDEINAALERFLESKVLSKE